MKENLISKLYKDGNFTGVSQTIFIVLGFVLLFGWLVIKIDSKYGVSAMILLGFLLLSVGGFSARAQLSGLRVFGKSDWRRAKETYKDGDDDSLN